MDVFSRFQRIDRLTEYAFVVHNAGICFSQVMKDSFSLRRCTSCLFSTDAISITNPPQFCKIQTQNEIFMVSKNRKTLNYCMFICQTALKTYNFKLHCKMKRANLAPKMGPKWVSPEWYCFWGQFSPTEMGLFWYQNLGLN